MKKSVKKEVSETTTEKKSSSDPGTKNGKSRI